MSQVRVDVISIGTLSRNLIWKETEPVRTPHATCTLIRTRDRNILVDPGLAPQIIAARLFERTGLKPQQIDTIFATTARPAHRGGDRAFVNAVKFMHENELQASLRHLERLLDETDDAQQTRFLEREIEQLTSYRPAEDKIALQVDLFPLFGFTPGTCGLLIAAATHTTLIASDAVASQDHFLAGQVLPGCFNLEQAKESLEEAYEIADVIIPGHDNLFMNPRNYGH